MLQYNPIHYPFSLPGDLGFQVYDYPEGFNLTNATEATSASAAAVTQASYLASILSAAGIPTSTTSYLRTIPTPGIRDVNYPPYVINNVQGDLATHAVTPNATHHNGI
jgi:alpha-glucosidase